MSIDTYSQGVKDLFSLLGISNAATEHSARRGGTGFRYFVLRETLDYIRFILRHESLAETLTYTGFYNRKHLYISQGYSTCAAGNIREKI